MTVYPAFRVKTTIMLCRRSSHLSADVQGQRKLVHFIQTVRERKASCQHRFRALYSRYAADDTPLNKGRRASMAIIAAEKELLVYENMGVRFDRAAT